MPVLGFGRNGLHLGVREIPTTGNVCVIDCDPFLEVEEMIQRRSQCVGAARYRPKICGVGGSGAGGDAVAVISTNPTDEKRGAKFCNVETIRVPPAVASPAAEIRFRVYIGDKEPLVRRCCNAQAPG